MAFQWSAALAVAAGGAVGATCRYGVGVFAKAFLPATLPFGTLLVNIIGSLVLGFLVGLGGTASKLPPVIYALVGTGFCGGFTTFSTFATETLTSGTTALAAINFVVNNVGALAGATLGIFLGRAVGSQ